MHSRHYEETLALRAFNFIMAAFSGAVSIVLAMFFTSLIYAIPLMIVWNTFLVSYLGYITYVKAWAIMALLQFFLRGTSS